MDCFSENEIVSLGEIEAQYGINTNDPMTWCFYYSQNREFLTIDEKDRVNEIIRVLTKKNQNIANRNREYMDKHLEQK
jgi:hypothetical protein